MEFKTIDIETRGNQRIGGVPVYVYAAGTTDQAATFDEDGGALAQPLTSDTSGQVSFAARNGKYDISATYGGETRVSENVSFFDDADAGVTQFSSATALAADTVLTYTAGQVGTVEAGDTVTTRDGLAYLVAASGATEYDGETAGGVKLTAQPGPDGAYSLAAFQQSGDASDAEAFARAAAKGDIPLAIPAGEYNTGVTATPVTIAPATGAEFRDSATGFYAPVTIRRRLADLTVAYRDKISASKSGQAAKIVCYGDSNTRYFFGSAGPLSKSYGKALDILAATRPHLYASTITVNGYPGETAEYGDTNFATNVPSDTDYLVIGFGTNNVKLATPNWESYSASIVSIMTKALALGAQPILLGIPWYSADYGSNGAQSQHLLRIWNARLHQLAEAAGVPFIDTYSLIQEYPTAYIDETSPQRHYNANATRIIAERIADVLARLMPSAQVAGWSKMGDWSDLSCLSSVTGSPSRIHYSIGNRRFDTLYVPSGASITLAGNGRACFGFYPRAAATVGLVALNESGGTKETATITIGSTVDGGEYYPIQRAALTFSAARSASVVTLTASSGGFYLRSASFEDGLLLPVNQHTQTMQQVAASALPGVGVNGREYFVTELQYAVRWYTSAWVSPMGLTAVGTTAQRDAVSAAGCPTGYKFYNTTASAMQRWNGSAWA